MKVEKRVHSGYAEWKKAKENGHKINLYFGEHQYIYSKSFFGFFKKVISLVKLRGIDEGWYWEIYCLKGKVFDDIERFETKDDAIVRIKELMK